MDSMNSSRPDANKAQIHSCMEILKEKGEKISEISNMLALAGNDIRLKILFLLKEEKKLCPSDMSEILGLNIPAISQHLRKLKDGKLLIQRRSGHVIYYSLNQKYLSNLDVLFNYIKSPL